MHSNSTVDIVANNTTRIYQQRDINVAIKRDIFPVVIYRKKRKGTERDLFRQLEKMHGREMALKKRKAKTRFFTASKGESTRRGLQLFHATNSYIYSQKNPYQAFYMYNYQLFSPSINCNF